MDRLVRLINDLLDLSKIEAGKMELKREDVDINLILKEVAGYMGFYVGRKNITLSVEYGEDIPHVACDRDRILQVVINLVMNAIKFTPHGGSIIIKSRLSKQNEAGSVEVSVRDTGSGMSDEEANSLFNRFKQLASPYHAKGTGLGLAISKALVDMHGGKIWVESGPGKGSDFKFTLPVTVR